MKAQLKLKWFISLVFVALGVASLVGYTLLAAYYFILGMDNMVANQMARLGWVYESNPSANGYSASVAFG